MVETVQKLREGYVTATVKSRDESFKGIQSSVDALPKPDGVSAYPAYIKSLREYKAKVEGTTLDLSTDGFENLVHENYRAKIVAYGDKVIEVNNNFEMQVSLIEDSKKLEAIEYNAKKNDELNISNQTYIDLEEKRKTLAEYVQEVLELCSE